MTFKDWTKEHKNKVKKILDKLSTLSSEEVVEYFNFDNMVEKEKDFCPLYETGTKCHNIKDLNCYFCGCPFFKNSDDEPMYVKDTVKVMSICTIGAKESSTFTHEGIQQCDCSKCFIPHDSKFVLRCLNGDIKNVSSLERVREYNLK